ncbi:glycosyltransferase family 2 protein [Microvirga sp. VF16]|uniref:glycosyltransferase family 2 protein n=1 Tax=Microvirga sp. VF16 TaxID=2807101 RepID=UPI00193D5DB7|nr:glycosyltransferase family 2 protein [Microvirga sp. VF16]QRM27240.1 glycosyltransferase family 2 protein [Microvirga sp. VF16]
MGYVDHLSADEASKETCSSRANHPVYVSIVMPIRNEAKFIERSLRTILSQDYPHNLLEVLIADGMSTDDTRQIIARIVASWPSIEVRIIDNPDLIVSTGLNLALKQARGDVIIRVDGHTFIEPDHVRQCVSALQKSGADHVGGRMVTVSEGRFGEAVSLATSSGFGVGHGRFSSSEREEWTDTVSMGAWPRQIFERIGLFDEEQIRNQDDEINYRLLEMGGKILISPNIKSSYYNRSTPRSLWRQYYQYGYWKIRVMQKHPSQMRLRQFIPPLFMASLILALFLAPFSTYGRWGVLLIAGSYIGANFVASVLTVRRADWHLIPRVALAFVILHFSYGLGFLVGLAKFWNRWHHKGQRMMLEQRR